MSLSVMVSSHCYGVVVRVQSFLENSRSDQHGALQRAWAALVIRRERRCSQDARAPGFNGP